MTQKFILPRPKRHYKQHNSQMVIKINAEAYNALIDMASESGRPIKDIASKAIIYASQNVQYEDEE